MRLPYFHPIIVVAIATFSLLVQFGCSDNLEPTLTEMEANDDLNSLSTMKLSRAYTSTTLPLSNLRELKGCQLKKEGDFFYLSDSLIGGSNEIYVEVEQNPFDEERTGVIEVIDTEGKLVRTLTITQAASSSLSQAAAYSGALQRSYGAGYGYNAFGCYTDYNEIRDQVISLPALKELEKKLHTSLMVDDFRPDTETTILEGADSETLLRALSMYAGVSADLLILQGEVKMSYASSDLKRNAFSFCTIFNTYTMASRHIDPYTLKELSHTYPEVYSAGFRHIVSKISEAVKERRFLDANKYIDEMFSLFGTHFIYYAGLGGRLTFTSTFERSALDSQTRLSKAAEASFLNMCGFKSEESQENTYKQVSTSHRRKLVACGGDVLLTSQILNSDEDELSKGIINQWFQSIHFEQDEPEKSNVELISTRLFPIHELVTDTAAARYIAAIYENEWKETDEIFPRCYNPVYSKLTASNFSKASSDNIKVLYANGEVMGEMMIEEVNGDSYSSFYPVIEGKVCRESTSLRNDKWYHLLWKSATECIVTEAGDATKDVLYFNNGSIGKEPMKGKVYKSPKTGILQLYTWNNWNSKFWKVGPYVLMPSPEAWFGTSRNNDRNYYESIYKDRPSGFENVKKDDLYNIIRLGNNPINDTNSYMIFNKTTDYKGILWIPSKNKTSEETLHPLIIPYQSHMLYYRTSDFRYP